MPKKTFTLEQIGAKFRWRFRDLGGLKTLSESVMPNLPKRRHRLLTRDGGPGGQLSDNVLVPSSPKRPFFVHSMASSDDRLPYGIRSNHISGFALYQELDRPLR